jgi:hypothetical protein
MEYSWRTGLFSKPTGWLELLEFGVHLHYWGETKMKCVLYRYQAAKLLDLLLGTAKCNK